MVPQDPRVRLVVKVQTGPRPPGGAVCSLGQVSGQGPASGPGAPLGESVTSTGGGAGGLRGSPSPSPHAGPPRGSSLLDFARLLPVAGRAGEAFARTPATFPGREAGVPSISCPPPRRFPEGPADSVLIFLLPTPPGPRSVRSCCPLPRSPPATPGPQVPELHLPHVGLPDVALDPTCVLPGPCTGLWVPPGLPLSLVT